ncbi:unnamed protein product, partial [Polarella glacialis]
ARFGSISSPPALFVEAAEAALRLFRDAAPSGAQNERRAVCRTLLAVACNAELALIARSAALQALLELPADAGGLEDALAAALEASWPSPLRHALVRGAVAQQLERELPTALWSRLLSVVGPSVLVEGICDAATLADGAKGSGGGDSSSSSSSGSRRCLRLFGSEELSSHGATTLPWAKVLSRAGAVGAAAQLARVAVSLPEALSPIRRLLVDAVATSPEPLALADLVLLLGRVGGCSADNCSEVAALEAHLALLLSLLGLAAEGRLAGEEVGPVLARLTALGPKPWDLLTDAQRGTVSCTLGVLLWTAGVGSAGEVSRLLALCPSWAGGHVDAAARMLSGTLPPSSVAQAAAEAFVKSRPRRAVSPLRGRETAASSATEDAGIRGASWSNQSAVDRRLLLSYLWASRAAAAEEPGCLGGWNLPSSPSLDEHDLVFLSLHIAQSVESCRSDVRLRGVSLAAELVPRQPLAALRLLPSLLHAFGAEHSFSSPMPEMPPLCLRAMAGFGANAEAAGIAARALKPLAACGAPRVAAAALAALAALCSRGDSAALAVLEQAAAYNSKDRIEVRIARLSAVAELALSCPDDAAQFTTPIQAALADAAPSVVALALRVLPRLSAAMDFTRAFAILRKRPPLSSLLRSADPELEQGSDFSEPEPEPRVLAAAIAVLAEHVQRCEVWREPGGALLAVPERREELRLLATTTRHAAPEVRAAAYRCLGAVVADWLCPKLGAEAPQQPQLGDAFSEPEEAKFLREMSSPQGLLRHFLFEAEEQPSEHAASSSASALDVFCAEVLAPVLRRERAELGRAAESRAAEGLRHPKLGAAQERLTKLGGDQSAHAAAALFLSTASVADKTSWEAKSLRLLQACEDELRVSEHPLLVLLVPHAWKLRVNRHLRESTVLGISVSEEAQRLAGKVAERLEAGLERARPDPAANAAALLAALGRAAPTVAEAAGRALCEALAKLTGPPRDVAIEALAGLLQSLPVSKRGSVLQQLRGTSTEGGAGVSAADVDLLGLAFQEGLSEGLVDQWLSVLGGSSPKAAMRLARCLPSMPLTQACSDRLMSGLVILLPTVPMALLPLSVLLPRALSAGWLPAVRLGEVLQAAAAAVVAAGPPLHWLGAARLCATLRRRRWQRLALGGASEVSPLDSLQAALHEWLAAPEPLAHRAWRDAAACELCGLALVAGPSLQVDSADEGFSLDPAAAQALMDFLVGGKAASGTAGAGPLLPQRSARTPDTASALCLGFLQHHLLAQRPPAVAEVLKEGSLLCACVSAVAFSGSGPGANSGTGTASALAAASETLVAEPRHAAALLCSLGSVGLLPDLRLGGAVCGLLERHAHHPALLASALLFCRHGQGGDGSLAALWVDLLDSVTSSTQLQELQVGGRQQEAPQGLLSPRAAALMEAHVGGLAL